jgi:MSHA biogenesis protein MshP
MKECLIPEAPVGGCAYRRARMQGFAMMTVVFLLVIMAGIATALGTWTARNEHLSGLSIRESRALSAARAGLQWGAYQVTDPRGTLNSATVLPSCFSTQTWSPSGTALPGGFSEFTVQVSCSRSPATGTYVEDARILAVYVLTAVATSGLANSPDSVVRKAEMRIAACKDPAGGAPTYGC